MCSTTSPIISPVQRHSGPRFDSPSSTRSAEGHRTSVGSWSGRRCTRHNGRDSPTHRRNGKSSSSFLAASYCSAGPALRRSLNQHRQTNSSLHRMCIGAAQRKLSPGNGERSLAPAYGRVPRADWLRRLSTTVLVNCAHFWLKGDGCSRRLGKISASTSMEREQCNTFSAFLDAPGPTNFPLSPTRYVHDFGGRCTELLVSASLFRERACTGDPNVT